MATEAPAPGRLGLVGLVQQLDADSRALAHYPQLPELHQLRQQWQVLHADSRLRIALQQAPAEGGPLNSAVLVHRMLARMQACSPAYLAHFVTYADTLAWLEQASSPAPASAATAGKAKAARKAPASGRRPR